MPTWTKEVVDLAVAGDALTIDSIKIDGTNIGHTDDTDLLGLASGTLTVNGIIAATSNATVGGTLSVTGNATVGGNLTVTGTLDLGDTNITNIGSIALDTITNDGSDITLDSSGDIILDADSGGDIHLKDGGTTFGQFDQSGGNLRIKNGAGLDTVLSFAGEDASFEGDVAIGDDLKINDTKKIYIGNAGDNDYILASGDAIDFYTNNAQRFSITDSQIQHYTESVYTNAGAVLRDASGHARLSFTDAGNTVLYDESGNTTMILDTSQNITLGGDLTISGGNLTKGTSILLDTNSMVIQSTGGGTSNTVFGKNAGDALTTNGNYNNFIGENAGTALTTGVSNVAIGYNALKTNIDGDHNIAIGSQALEDF